MTRTTSLTARRSFLLGAAALSALMAVPAVGQEGPAMPVVQISPWEGRDLKSWERDRLAALGDTLGVKLRGSGAEVKMLQNHLRVRLPAAISFVPGKDHMSPEGVALMTLVAEGLARQKKVRVEIVGHHDARSSEYEAYVFTQRRAQAARAALISRGTDPDRIKPTGLGRKFPYLNPATSPDNQRIELLFRPL